MRPECPTVTFEPLGFKRMAVDSRGRSRRDLAWVRPHDEDPGWYVMCDAYGYAIEAHASTILALADKIREAKDNG